MLNLTLQGMSLNEMLTCVRENIPVIAVVFNNEQWGAEKKNQVLSNRGIEWKEFKTKKYMKMVIMLDDG